MGAAGSPKAIFSPWCPVTRWGSGDELKRGKFHLNLTFSNSEALQQAQGAAESPSLEGLEPKRAMSEQQLWVSRLWAGVGLHKLQRSPPASAVLLLGGFK